MPIYTDITDDFGREVVQIINGELATYSVREGGVERFKVEVSIDRPIPLVLMTINAMGPG